MKVQLIWNNRFCGYEEQIIDVVDCATEKEIQDCFPAILGVKFNDDCSYNYLPDEPQTTVPIIEDDAPFVIVDGVYYILGRGTVLAVQKPIDYLDKQYFNTNDKIYYRGNRAEIRAVEGQKPCLVNNGYYMVGLVLGKQWEGLDIPKGERIYLEKN